MTSRRLDESALALFARKGFEGGPEVPQAGLANGVKVRRVLQVTHDFAGPLDALRILDLGCGEGVYSIEAALHGAEVVAVDARRARMDQGRAVALRHDLTRVRFEQADVRAVDVDRYGRFDVVWALGILYHLEAPDALALLERVFAIATRLVVIDTLIAMTPESLVHHDGLVYEGERRREHGDDDSAEVRAGRVLKSIDNTFSFRFTRPALVRALVAAGFNSVVEVHAPLEPGKAADRVTLVARPGAPLAIATYPDGGGARCEI